MRRLTAPLAPVLLAILAGCAGWPHRQAAPAAPTAASAGVSPATPVATAPAAPATAPPAPTHAPGAPVAYFPAGALDLYRLLPPPPAAGSARERAELDEMLSIQVQRTPADVARARADAQVDVSRFADALGAPQAVTGSKLPLTTRLLRGIALTEGSVVIPAKDRFDRPRPFLTERKLKPVIDKPGSASYPSGHSTWATAVAIVLADMVPERRAQILARADEYAHDRVVAGVHYPSDVSAGHTAGAAIAARLFMSPRFRADEAAAAAELRAALGLPPPAQSSAALH